MWKNKKNVICIGVASLTAIIIVLLYYCQIIENLLIWLFISSAVWSLILLCSHAYSNLTSGICFALAAFLISAGVGQTFSVMTQVGMESYVQIVNADRIKSIVKGSISEPKSHIYVMSYDGYDYYVDTGYTYVYKIKENGLLSEVEVYNIFIASDIESVLQEKFGEFYIISNNEAFSGISNLSISISFVLNSPDESVFLKLISPDNKVYYSYLPISNAYSFAKDVGIASETFSVGTVKFILTPSTKIVNGAVSDSEVEAEDGLQYLITAADEYSFLSPICAISFAEKIGYSDRIHQFIYHKNIEEIERLEKELDGLSKDSDSYKEMSAYIETLKSYMQVYSCELIYEYKHGNDILRLYRARDYSEDLTETPPISVIEIQRDDYYVYSYTQLEIEQLF